MRKGQHVRPHRRRIRKTGTKFTAGKKELKYPEAKAEYLYGYRSKSQQKVYMHPSMFLLLTPYWPMGDEKVVPLMKKMKKGVPIDPLFLDVDIDTMRVVNHEGRHRAEAAKRLGITDVPVILYLKKGGWYIERYFLEEEYPPKEKEYQEAISKKVNIFDLKRQQGER